MVREIEGGANKFLITGDRVDVVGRKWSVGSLTVGARPLPSGLTPPWERQPEVICTGICRSRHLGVLVETRPGPGRSHHAPGRTPVGAGADQAGRGREPTLDGAGRAPSFPAA